MRDETCSSDYEWRDGHAPRSHYYLAPVIDRIVEDYGKKRDISVSKLRVFDVGSSPVEIHDCQSLRPYWCEVLS